MANDIEVRLPSSAERTDADVAAAALRALEWDALVPADKPDITVSKGWVTLKGEVECQDPPSTFTHGVLVFAEASVTSRVGGAS